MAEDHNDLNTDAEERLAFWSKFLNTEEGRLVVGDLNDDEMKHFHADGILYELRQGDEGQIIVRLVERE